MENQDLIDELKMKVALLNAMLEQPEPGLGTWCFLFVENMNDLVKIWNNRGKKANKTHEKHPL